MNLGECRFSFSNSEIMPLFFILSLNMLCFVATDGFATKEEKISFAVNSKPIVGVVVQELPLQWLKFYPTYSAYVASSYVKAIESAGARVVPILLNKSQSYYRQLLNSINGIVLPGGAAQAEPGHPYFDVVKIVYKIAIEINDAGQLFPILGVCLGFEFLLTIANGGRNFLKPCDVPYECYPLSFTVRYPTSILYSHLTHYQYDILRRDNVTVNAHKLCAFQSDFNQSSLKAHWRVTTTTFSTNAIEFISSVENTLYPFFGIQFHPEKVSFEWCKTCNYITHTQEATIVNRYFYDTLVRFARKNGNKFNDLSIEDGFLIYKYPAKYVEAQNEIPFTQIYLF